MIFSIKDSLRQAVEAASGGLNTVVYTKKGQPCIMRVIPKFRVETLDTNLGTGVHPAFIVGGREVPEILIGVYPGHVSNGEVVSLPGVPPSTAAYSDAIALARANGPGFHHLTAAEWAAVALQSIHSIGGGNDPVYGPNPFGISTGNPKQFGRRVDGRPAGDTTAMSRVLTGSGPLNWRHDLTPFGIADLVVEWHWPTWAAGAILRNSEINVIPNNDAALSSTDLSLSSSAWRAIMPDGTLVPPGTSGTLKFDIPPTANYSNDNVAQSLGVPYLRTTRQTPPWPDVEDPSDPVTKDFAFADRGLSSLQKDPSNLSVPKLLNQLLLFPHVSSITRGYFSVRPYGKRPLAVGYGAISGVDFGNVPQASFSLRIAYIPL
ncbi:hypothetical protein YIM73518_16690 [Thermus brockianus]